MSTIYDLPDEVLEFLFSKLQLSDRKHTRLVSKQWLEVCNSASITKQEVIIVTKEELNQFRTPRGKLNLQVYGIENPCSILQFWQQHGISLRTLKLFGVQMRFSELCDIIRFCPNLENLTISYNDREAARTKYSNSVDPFAHLDRILNLNVDVDVDLWGLTKSWPKLNRLELINCDVISRKETLIKTIMLLIVNVTELFFIRCLFITKQSLKAILDQIGHQLTGLYLSSFRRYYVDQSLPTIPNKLIKLENLQLNHFIKNLGFLHDFFMPLKNLKLISLKGTELIDYVLLNIAGLELLQGLDIGVRYNSRLTAHGFMKAFGRKQHPNLIDIRLANLQCVTNDVLATILPQLPNLECLDLNGCKNISELGVSAIVTNCKRLKHLSLQSCYRIQTLMEPASINNLKSLVHLNLFGCPQIPISSIANELKLDLLKTMELNYPTLSKESIQLLMVNLPSLQRVQLRYSEGVDEEAFIKMFGEFTQICKFTRGNKALNIVSIFDFSALYI